MSEDFIQIDPASNGFVIKFYGDNYKFKSKKIAYNWQEVLNIINDNPFPLPKAEVK